MQIDDLFNQLQGSSVYSKIDLELRNHELKIKQKDIYKIAFTTRYVHYKFTVMSFGLTNVPTTYIDFINWVLKHFLDQFVDVFIDDILAYSQSIKEQEEHLREVLQVFWKQKLFTKLKKHEFWFQKVVFFGHVIFEVGVSADSKKVETIKN